MSYDNPVYEDEFGFFNYTCDDPRCKLIATADSKAGAEKMKREHLVEKHGYKDVLIPPAFEKNASLDKAFKIDRKLRRKLR